MMSHEAVKEAFKRHADRHEMRIQSDIDVFRTVEFSRPGSSIYAFKLITWPGCLCIQGDMGTYVFKRVHDMFGFFVEDADEEPRINPGYWGEKLQSIDKKSGYREFSPEVFTARVWGHFNDYVEAQVLNDDALAEVWRTIREDVLCNAYENGEAEAYQSIHDFELDEFLFQDFFDGGGCEDFTYHYLWCLYAIVWGIREYRRAKEG